jgi:putative DNA primase/helicase
MKLEALPQTNIIKSLVTAELPMDLEKKGVQSYQGTMYARLIGFGNGTMKSLHDRSLGFFRRQIILTTKDRPPDRVDDPFLSEKLAEEREGIFLWAFEGLQRLIANNYRFTVSERSQENLKQSIEEGNNVLMFLQSEGYISFADGADTASAKLYELYSLWCEDNAFPALTKTGFSRQFGLLAKDYGLVKHNNVKYHNARVWGYRNIRALQ